MRLNPFRRTPDSPTNEALLKALVALASQSTAQNHHAFYTLLLKSTLLMAEDPEAGPRPIMFVDELDQVILPIFTDMQRLLKVCPDARGYASVSISQVCQLALGNDIYQININPEHGPGCYLTRDDMEALANNKIPNLTPTDIELWNKPNFVPMGDSKLPDEETMERIVKTASEVLQQAGNVKAAYLILYGGDEGSTRLTIALEFQETANHDDKTTLTKQLVSSLEASFNQPFYVLWLGDEKLAAVRSRVPPFYEAHRES
jgi:hypothetical protein